MRCKYSKDIRYSDYLFPHSEGQHSHIKDVQCPALTLSWHFMHYYLSKRRERSYPYLGSYTLPRWESTATSSKLEQVPLPFSFIHTYSCCWLTSWFQRVAILKHLGALLNLSWYGALVFLWSHISASRMVWIESFLLPRIQVEYIFVNPKES